MYGERGAKAGVGDKIGSRRRENLSQYPSPARNDDYALVGNFCMFSETCFREMSARRHFSGGNFASVSIWTNHCAS